MPYIDDEGNYPLYPTDIWAVVPEWRLGSEPPAGFHEFTTATPPSLGENQTYSPQAPVEQADGSYLMRFVAVDLPAEEIEEIAAFKALRLEQLLERYTQEEIDHLDMLK